MIVEPIADKVDTIQAENVIAFKKKKEGVNDIATALTAGESFPKKSMRFLAVKRVFDVATSCIGLLLLSPLLLITALAIKLEDGGPVFFIQERVGKDEKVFRMYKFRSMCMDAPVLHQQLLSQNELDGPAFKMKYDPRVTKIGGLIRKTSVDELPQLVNIIKGDMSIVGPRPLPVYEQEQCSEYQKQRLLVTPGLTCYWQVCGRSSVPFEEWVEMDLRYIRERSVWVDAKLIGKTMIAVIRFASSYQKNGSSLNR